MIHWWGLCSDGALGMQRRACSWRKPPLRQGQMTLGKASAAPSPIRQARHDTQSSRTCTSGQERAVRELPAWGGRG